MRKKRCPSDRINRQGWYWFEVGLSASPWVVIQARGKSFWVSVHIITLISNNFNILPHLSQKRKPSLGNTVVVGLPMICLPGRGSPRELFGSIGLLFFKQCALSFSNPLDYVGYSGSLGISFLFDLAEILWA